MACITKTDTTNKGYKEVFIYVDSQNSESPSKLLVMQSVPKQQGFLVKWP